ncbi:MAG: hypothetical protein ABI700_14415, partial [Chloroflexota bacterium]
KSSTCLPTQRGSTAFSPPCSHEFFSRDSQYNDPEGYVNRPAPLLTSFNAVFIERLDGCELIACEDSPECCLAGEFQV